MRRRPSIGAGVAAAVIALAAAGPAAAADPPLTATPRASCGPGSNPEPGMQGRVSKADIASGRARNGFNCNLTQIGRQGASGGYKVLRYVDRAGRECAYYDTTLLFPLNVTNLLAQQPTGVAVLDMSNPSRPRQTATLNTLAMLSPHESVLLNQRRGLLAAVMGNPAFAPGIVDIYDLSADCRKPVLRSSLPVGFLGHESGFAPDGRTFYTASPGSKTVVAVDVTDPAAPRPIWNGRYDSHGLTISDDGNRAYIAGTGSGLTILDTSQIQARRPNPQVPVVSRLDWPVRTIPQVALPVTIKGRPYLVEVDEFSSPMGNGAKVGAARIIDISDERAPRIVSNIRLEVNQPENRAQLAGDPGANSPVQGYAGHYCGVPQRTDPGIVACSFILSGLRVFDIRDPLKPREIAYFVAPPRPSPVLAEPSNFAMSSPSFVPSRGEIWYSDGNSGFYALRATNGVWPFPAGSARGRRCLAPRSPIGPRNIGRVRVGSTRRALARRIPSALVLRTRLTQGWCVRGTPSRVIAVFGAASSRGAVRLVVTRARRYGNRGVRPGVSTARLRRAFPRRRRVARGLYRAGPGSPRLIGVRRGRVRFVGVAQRRLIARPRTLARYLRRAGL